MDIVNKIKNGRDGETSTFLAEEAGAGLALNYRRIASKLNGIN
jgi:hypothetical protein